MAGMSVVQASMAGLTNGSGFAPSPPSRSAGTGRYVKQPGIPLEYEKPVGRYSPADRGTLRTSVNPASLSPNTPVFDYRSNKTVPLSQVNNPGEDLRPGSGAYS